MLKQLQLRENMMIQLREIKKYRLLIQSIKKDYLYHFYY